MVAPSFLTKNSLSDNVIAKYSYMPRMQYQNQTAEAYDWRAATRILRHPHFESHRVPKFCLFCEKTFRSISVFKSKRVDKIKSGNFMLLSMFILSK